MLTRTELSRLERSLRGTRMLSVYLDGAADDPAERTAWRRALSADLDAWRSALHDAPHDEREAFARAVERLDAHLAALPAALRSPGWVGFVGPDGVAYDETLPNATPTLVAWADGIRIAPYFRALAARRPAVVAVLDARTAHVHAYRDRALVAHETLHAHAPVGPVTHMGDAPRAGFHAGTRGETGTDAAEHARQVGRARMLRELAERLEQLAGADGWILVGGIPEVATAAVAALLDDVRPRARALEGLDVHATAAQIAERAEQETPALQAAADAASVDDILARYGAGGTASVGEAGTREALREHAVDRLVLTARFVRDAPLAAEELVRSALDQDAAVACVEGVAAERLDAEAGGIAARLRFDATREQPPVAAARA